jgi:hypothetical protein
VAGMMLPAAFLLQESLDQKQAPENEFQPENDTVLLGISVFLPLDCLKYFMEFFFFGNAAVVLKTMKFDTGGTHPGIGGVAQ